ncbi:restriction endonuclease subunit S [Vibrio splendidus]|nr:restriction endonuclease subunit S [Vibrio splendidus]MCC4788759.1 restriction endonuclease subunit S [Vibrio splendidus]
MNQLITDNIDVWTSTVKTKSASGRGSSKKRELYGVKKLRELILELAVRGKLVPQDPTDEPASALVERIAEEKAQLVKDKKIKKPKKLPDATDNDIPFKLPSGWSWGRVNELSKQVTDGVHHTPKYIEEGVPFISVKDINGRTVSFDDCKYISQEQHVEINQRCNPEFGDVLLCRIGTLGRATIVDTTEPFSLFVSVGLLKFFNEYLLSDYLHKVFHSPLLLKQYDEIKAGGSHTNKLNLGDIPKLWLPVAPISEQHRIVAKVDELMTLCDQLEQQTEASIEAHQVLVTTLLDTLTNSADAEELMQNWARISEHFDTLFTTEASIDQLKQTILQLAVMGKLVPQDPNDEPAAKLLERIAEEKAQLIKDKKIKKQKALPPIAEDEKPFELPNGWEWCRVGDLSLSSESGWSPKCLDTPRETGKWGVLKVSAVTWGIYNPDENKELPSALEPREQIEVKAGDFLISRANTAELVAKAVIVPSDSPEKLMMSDKIIRFRFSETLEANYINLFNNSGFARDYYAEVAGGTSSSMKNVSRVQINNLVVALPPKEEQNKIVCKVAAFFTLCDQLKVQLKESQTTQLYLTDAIVDLAV